MTKNNLHLFLIVFFLPVLVYSNFTLEPVFDSHQFDYPLGIEHAGDGSGRLFIVEKAGFIYSVFPEENLLEINSFLDISDRVDSDGYEMGLLGLTFHPDFQENGYFFLNYTADNPRRNVISQFSVYIDNPDSGNPDSEFVILEQDQPYQNHNGGQMDFGQDGYLYISFGDGGGTGDPLNSAQNLSNILGSIIRINVNQIGASQNYTIPETNPFHSIPGVREEIYAYGLRNTWRFSIDEVTGQIWGGDVGQDLFEEINLIESGGNYGWNIMEGFHCYNSDDCDTDGLIMPLLEYDHELNCSVSGGFVYRGSIIPYWYGKYIYGDYCSGKIWSLESMDGDWINEELMDTEIYISSFGLDEADELYLCSLYDGIIYRFQTDVSMIQGDVNLDYNVNITDVVLLVQYILTDQELDEHLFWICDFNNDGQVNVVDLVLIVDFILNGNG